MTRKVKRAKTRKRICSSLSPINHPVIVYDTSKDEFGEFYQQLEELAPQVSYVSTVPEMIEELSTQLDSIALLDTRNLAHLSEDESTLLREFQEARRIGLVTVDELENYFNLLKNINVTQVYSKIDPPVPEELEHFLECISDPLAGFSLSRYLYQTSELLTARIDNHEEKNIFVERVINYFATNGFEIHQLYNVRLILEETLNNAIFHAFKDNEGNDKYQIGSFDKLDENEKVTIEYGHCSAFAGFTVTDNAGALSPETVFKKLERQFSKDALFDESGRGLYLSRMLSSCFVINIEEGKRTQMIALFDDQHRERKGPKPFMLNYIGSNALSDCFLDADLD